MPANLVTGDDAEDVAAYVARVAGLPGRRGGGGADGGPRRRRQASRTARRSSLAELRRAATRSRPRARAAPSARTSTSAKPSKDARRRARHERRRRDAAFKGQLSARQQIQAVAEVRLDDRRQVARLDGSPAGERPSSRSASRSTTTCVIGTAKRARAPLDDAPLEPVRAALGMRRDHDLVRAEGAQRVLDAPAAARRRRSRRARRSRRREPREARLEPLLRGRARAVLVRDPVAERRVERRADDEDAARSKPSAALGDAPRAARAADRLVGDHEDPPLVRGCAGRRPSSAAARSRRARSTPADATAVQQHEDDQPEPRRRSPRRRRSARSTPTASSTKRKASASLRNGFCIRRLLEEVDGRVHDDPHYVDEVPVDPGISTPWWCSGV